MPGRRVLRRPGVRAWLLVGPVVAFLAIAFLLPLFEILLLSFSEGEYGLGAYVEFFTTDFYNIILLRTFGIAFLVTLFCLLLAYPLAYVIVRVGGGLGFVLLLIVAMSFWTSFLVRIFAWLVILGNRGPVIGVLEWLAPDATPEVLFTRFSVVLGLVHGMIPFMVMAIYASMRKIDPNNLRAAASLGATPLQGFRHVFLPLSLPGVVNGCTLVFIICAGFYVTPVILGGAQDKMIAGLIGQQIEELLEWGEASAMAMVLLFAILILYALYNRFVGLDKLWG
ncbi:MAG: ABC transporter permease [Rhodospirillaceae bacterium]